MPNYQEKKLGPNSWYKYVFGLMTPPKKGVSTNIGKKLCHNAAVSRSLKVTTFFPVLRAYFVGGKNLELGKNSFLWMLKKI